MNHHAPRVHSFALRFVAAIALITFACHSISLGETKKPNVLFISIDDLNDWIASLKGHPQAITPNLDRLLARSVRFTNAHCTAPVCSASRHSVLSGLRPSTTGWYINESKPAEQYQRILGPTVPMPTHFKRHGYQALAAGKIFHSGVSDVRGYDYWHDTRPKFKWPKRLAQRGHGYQGKNGGHFHPFPPDGGGIYQHFGKGVSGQSLCAAPLGENDIPAEGMPDEQIAAWAVERLKQRHDRPFFLAVGFLRPHVPYTAPKSYFDLYDAEKIHVPSVPANEMRDIPPFGKAMAFGMTPGGDQNAVNNITKKTGSSYARQLTHGYLACVSFVDAQVGKVLDALDAGDYKDNTIIVLWSDHGQHLGEKRHWRKQCLWEESTRVPLAIALPNKSNEHVGKPCRRAVSLLDLYPTLVELCDLPPVNRLEGHSLVPLLNNPTAPREQPAITTWYYKNHAVRSDRWRYIRYRDGSEELYDHTNDPGEHHNLAGKEKFADVVAAHRKWLPRKDALPAKMETWTNDQLGQLVDKFKREGVPGWLKH